MLKRSVLAFVFALATALPASAQWQVPSGSIPVGKGPGAAGFNTVTGSAGGGTKCLLDTNPPSFGTCPGGGGTPGGSNGQGQYNNAGAFGGYTVSGDMTAVFSTGVFTLATVNGNVGSFGSATQCAAFTANAKGLITAASQAVCTPAITSVTGLGAGVATWLGTPNSANLRTALTDETGTGAAVFATNPALTAPTISGPPPAVTATGAARINLTADTSFFVRIDGNDSFCTGLTNAAYVSGAYPQACGKLTIQNMYDTLANSYDLQGYVATINVGNGTYTTGLVTAKCVPGQNGTASVKILGNATPSNVIVSTTSADAFGLGETSFGNGTTGCTQITIGGMRLQTTTAGNAVNVSGGGVGITVGSPGFPIDFGLTAQDHLVANHAAWIIAGTNNSISGGALIHAAAVSNSVVAEHNTTITCTGSPAFTYFNYADTTGSVFSENITFSGCGTATGIRYFAQNFGNINSGSASATYLPGNSSGITQSFGNYITASPSVWSISQGGTGQTANGTAGQTIQSTGAAAAMAWVNPGVSVACARGVNFNSANTDNQITIFSPTGNYAIFRILIANASASISTATMGVFSSTGGGGTTIVSTSALTITTSAANTNNNMMPLFNGSFTQSFNFSTVQARVGTAQGSAATADVCVYYIPL